ncbi:Na/Pi cotransporter family protein [Luteolibacter sp. AS25]|uniref:Na/Pi cotransporter family protein n=1 Tax=Luteolibacter sp. AS25 TaxID=3135776 RepID=UPI00398A6958
MFIASFSIWSTAASLLTVLGSLGIFLYGMKIMSEGVQKVAGDKMRAALAGMTSTRFRGVITGFFTTTLVQSSSASTVLVVSFVNAGLLTLVQATGVIMGANLGTTTTAWIVALIGKFSVAKISLPMIGIGLPLFFAGKNKGRNWGEALIGFGLVFLGLGLLKDSVPDLKSMLETDPAMAHQIENIIRLLSGHGFGSVIFFMLAGIVLTLLVQSSSAAMAITITCALNGWFGDVATDPMGVFRCSAAIVLGENIGTTVTAWLASTGASTNAKRAARAHFTFNVTGVIWCLVLFYPFTSIVWDLAGKLPPGLRSANAGLSQSEIAFATAIFHSVFNLANILLLVWFIPQIERVVTWWVKDDEKDSKTKLRYIGSSLVDIGELSLAEADIAVKRMADLTSEMFDGMMDVFGRPHEDLSERVAELKNMEDVCDEMLHDITSYLIQCSTHEIGSGNAAHITSLLRIAAELEEATDRIYRMVKVVQRKYEKGRDFTEIQHKDLSASGSEVRMLLIVTRNSLHNPDPTTLERANAIEDRVDRLRKKNNKAASQRMQNGSTVQTEMIFVDLNNHMEAVANHLLNVVEASEPSIATSF